MNLLTDAYYIPYALRLTKEERAAAWERNPPRPMPQFGQERTPTEIAYYQSIEADKAAKRAKDEVRWAALKAKKDAERAERDTVAQAIRRRMR